MRVVMAVGGITSDRCLQAMGDGPSKQVESRDMLDYKAEKMGLAPQKRLIARTIDRKDRRFAREHVNIRAFLHYGGRFQPTLIRDISHGGAGLQGAVGVIPGDRVSIELLDGRKLTGRVKWWLAGNCGVAFDTNLSETDPLIVKAASSTR